MKIADLYPLFLSHPTLSTDSRDIKPGCIFFALKGPNFNGNSFAVDALKKGAAYAVVDENLEFTDNRLIHVENVLETLQNLARHHREQFQIPVLGITGSNGKTTTKELISAVLKKKYRLVYSAGNLNNHIGVPMTLLKINLSTEIAVIEMGANAPGEIAMLCRLAQPNNGLITSIGKAHLEGFGDLNTIIETKKALFQYVVDQRGKLFINNDIELLIKLIPDYDRIILYGSTEKAKWKTKLLQHSPFVHMAFYADDHEYIIDSRLTGAYNYANLQSAVAVGLEFKVAPLQIADALENYEPSNNRSQLMKTANNLLILDAYNANPSSMKASLESFLEYPGISKAVILGDMLELGKEEDEEHREIIRWLEKHPAIKVFLAGPIFSRVNSNKDYLVLSNSAVLKEYLLNNPIKGHVILIKGSRGTAVEKVIDAL